MTYKKMIFLFILLLSNSTSLMKYNFIMSVRNLIIISNTPEIYNIASKQIDGSCNKLSLEHIFPKCYMNKKSYNDLHNIYKCNNLINNYRSNYKYTDESIVNITDFKKLYNTNNDQHINTNYQDDFRIADWLKDDIKEVLNYHNCSLHHANNILIGF